MKKMYFSMSFYLILVFSLNSFAVPKNSESSGFAENEVKSKKPTITKNLFGSTDGQDVYEYTLTNRHGMMVKVINYGGTISDIITPDKNGEMASVVLGFDTLEEYKGGKNALMGATVGRVANRISNAKFTLDGKEYKLSSFIHGGVGGFHRRVWNIEEVPGKSVVALKMTYFSKDGEEGFPGNLNVTITYSLTNKNELKIDYTATTDKATPLVLTNHTYFNLSGGKEANVLDTELSILAGQYLEAADQNIPTGNIFDVKDTPFDFTEKHPIGKQIADIKNASGYDLTYVLRNQSGKLAKAASAYEPGSGRAMEVYTTEPGVVFYTSNHLNERITGRGGKPFAKYGAFCLETQHYPDSPNKPNFPNTILKPGETFKSQTIYKFSVKE
ncbi:aldose epimerase family protein [Sunxiuqinia sp. A32]|uniref:aldose epimerase family protein n=1 Tax=Sunxiuqinia sp. A32 TaxID=3461496 RepID=UPI0040466B80